MNKPLKHILRYWYVYLIATLCLASAICLDMLGPRITMTIIDEVIGKGRTELLTRLLLGLIGIGVGRAVCGYFKEFLFDKMAFRYGTDTRRHLFGHIQSLSVGFFDKTNTGEVMARLKEDVEKLQNMVGFIGMLVIEVIIHVSLVLYNMFRISPKLTIFPLIALPLAGALAIVLENKLDKVFGDISEENAEMNTVAEENLAGVRTVKAFAREKYEIGKFLSHNKKFYDLNMRQSILWLKYHPFFELIYRALPLVVLLIGGRMVMDEELTLGSLGAFIEYCGNIVWPMEMLGWLANEVAGSIASSKKLKKIYAEEAQITDPRIPVTLEKASGHVTFEHASLSIDDKQILKDISFDLPSGKTLGIMGATGSGKSSIINLLMRFYDPTEGRVLLDEVDIRDMKISDVRGSLAPVMQDTFLFSDTISGNVKMGRKAAVTDEKMKESLKLAQAKGFVEKLEDGYDTVVGERGVGLSGGQKQRISIARAFAKENPVLILDDSTSALDMETEREIQKELEAMKGVTKIIVAHRISAVRKADEIIILENGSILERGTHDELLAQKGYYFKTWQAQYGQ